MGRSSQSCRQSLTITKVSPRRIMRSSQPKTRLQVALHRRQPRSGLFLQKQKESYLSSEGSQALLVIHTICQALRGQDQKRSLKWPQWVCQAWGPLQVCRREARDRWMLERVMPILLQAITITQILTSARRTVTIVTRRVSASRENFPTVRPPPKVATTSTDHRVPERNPQWTDMSRHIERAMRQFLL